MAYRSTDDGENLVFADDDVVGAVDLHFAARVLAHEDLVALLDVERNALAVFEAARADGDDFTLLRLLLGGVRDDDPALLHFGLLETTDENAIRQRLHIDGHCFETPSSMGSVAVSLRTDVAGDCVAPSTCRESTSFFERCVGPGSWIGR